MADKKRSDSSSGKKIQKSVVSDVQEAGASKAGKPRKARQIKEQEELKQRKARKEARKLQQIKLAFERGEIKTFDDIFVYIDPTPFGNLIGLQFYSFEGKIEDPGKFTFNDVTRFSNAVAVDFDLVNSFITNLIKDPARKTTARHRPLYFNLKR